MPNKCQKNAKQMPTNINKQTPPNKSHTNAKQMPNKCQTNAKQMMPNKCKTIYQTNAKQYTK